LQTSWRLSARSSSGPTGRAADRTAVNPYYAHRWTGPGRSTETRRPCAVAPPPGDIARLSSPGWLLAVSDAGVPSIEAWQEVIAVAPELGVPVLAHAEGLPVPRAPLRREELAKVAEEWGAK